MFQPSQPSRPAQTSRQRLPVSRILAILSVALLLATPLATRAAEVAGVKLDDYAKVAGKDLRLNGAGVRTRAIFKVYAMGLYLAGKETTTEAVLAALGPRRVTLVMMRDVSGDDMNQAFTAGISSNTDKAELARLAPQLAKLSTVFASAGELKKGDTLHVDWVPERGTVITHNGKTLGDPIAEQSFNNALLKIWLGDKPVDSSLKPALLGG